MVTAAMFAPSTSRPPFFTPPAHPVWTPDDLPQPTGVQRLHTAQSPPPFQTEPSARSPARCKRKAASSASRGKRRSALIHTLPAPHLVAALDTHSLLHTLSTAVQDTAAPTQTALQSLYNDVLTVATQPSTQQNASSNGRHKHALMLRLILSGVLWVEMQGKGKEELDLFDNCCSHLDGLLVLAVNGRAAQSDDGGAAGNAKRNERPRGGKLTVAEEVQAYRTAMLARALPQCLQNNARTLYHVSLVGVSTNWAALSALLPSLPFLHHLHVQQCDMTDAAAGHLLAALSGSGVTHLSLSSNRLTDAVVHPLCRLILSQALRREDLEWQWRLRAKEPQPTQSFRQRHSADARTSGAKNEAIREQGLLSVDVSGNLITDDGILRLIDTLADDRWLLAVLLHDNLHSEKAVAAFFGMLAHNTALLHYTVMPVPPAAPALPFSPSSPRSPRPTSPRAVPSFAASAARFWSSVLPLCDPHLAARMAGSSELHRRQLLLSPRLTLNDQSAARFGHGMRGQRDAQLAAAIDPKRLLAVVETARLVPWDKVVRQRQDEMRLARADGRPPSARPQSARPMSPSFAHLRLGSAASFSTARSTSRPSTAAAPTVSPVATGPRAGDSRQPPAAAPGASRAAGGVKPLPLALLDSLFAQLEAVDLAHATPRQPPLTAETRHSTDDRPIPALSAVALAPASEPRRSELVVQQGHAEHMPPPGMGLKAFEEQKRSDDGPREEEAEWRRLQQWASEQQRKAGTADDSKRSDGPDGTAQQLATRETEARTETVPSLIRPSGQLLSLSDLLDDED